MFLALAVPNVASAHRPASEAQRKGMVYQASGRYYGDISVSEPRSAPLRCFIADITTVVRGARWGAWTFSPYADQVKHSRQCITGDGIAVEHRIGKRWYCALGGQRRISADSRHTERLFSAQSRTTGDRPRSHRRIGLIRADGGQLLMSADRRIRTRAEFLQRLHRTIAKRLRGTRRPEV
jgi:hypothetical protein